MRLHVLGLAHTETTAEHLGCAYTQKVVRFTKMMLAQGHEVILYAGERNEAEVSEHVQVISRAEQEEILGPFDPNKIYDPDWYGPAWKLANNRTVEELRARIKPRDFICVSAGLAQKSVCDKFPNHMVVETGIGYEGTFAKYRVFESYAWMHYLAGKQGNDNVDWYDAVIPNFYDVNDFPLGTHGGDYLLWIGRFIERKGPHIAQQIASAAKMPLILAGQGTEFDRKKKQLWGPDGTMIKGDGFEHVGPVNAVQRAKLMGGARAVIVPTTYLGPFEGVAVEAMLCGTPIITTDWGVFPEYNIDGETGFRFRTLGEAVAGVAASEYIDHRHIRSYAQQRFSLEHVGILYSAYFAQLYDLWDEGWNSLRVTSGRYK